MRARRNIVVSSASGAGRTIHTNALGNDIPAGERVVTIEDCLELQSVVRLTAQEERKGAREVSAVTAVGANRLGGRR